ncbi:MAG: DUF4232 domain-containing protein [Acidimicrobiales bacterium]
MVHAKVLVKDVGVVAVGAVVAVAVLASGCGSGPTKAAPGRTTSTTTATPTPSVATTTPTTSAPPATLPATTVPSSTTAPPGPSACTSSQIGVSLGSGGAGLGHVGYPVLFTNKGTTSCVLGGYPGVALLDASGHQAVQAMRTPGGYLGGLSSESTTPPVLTVAPGQTVSALLEGTDIPVGAATSCPSYPAVLVTPPNQHVPILLQFAAAPVGFMGAFPGCSTPEIHPVVSGSTGRQG